MRSPIFKVMAQTQQLNSQLSYLQRIRENGPIQYHDLRHAPPKKYNVNHHGQFKSRQYPLYPHNKVVHEDYQRVMKEYQTIEDQEDKKRQKHQYNGVKKISPHKKREVEKQNPDSSKLKEDEIPYKLLLKIDKMVQLKLKDITPDFLKAFARENNIILRSSGKEEDLYVQQQDYQAYLQQMQQNTQKINHQDMAADNPKSNSEIRFQNTKAVEIELNEYEQWYLKKQIEDKLRQTFINETLKNLNQLRTKQKEETKEDKQKRIEKLLEWHSQKEITKQMKKGWDQRMKQMSELDKEEKQAQGKRAFMNWLKNHCEKLKVKKANEEEMEYALKLKEENEQIMKHLRNQESKKAYKKWLKDIKERELNPDQQFKRPKRRQSFDYGQNVRRRNLEEGTNMPLKRQSTFTRDKLVNIMIEPNRKQNKVSDQFASLSSPSSRYSNTSSKKKSPNAYSYKSPKRSGSKKKKATQGKKKFSVNRNHMKQMPNGYFEVISEEKEDNRSSENSFKQNKQSQEISSIQRNNNHTQQQNNTVESMMGMYGIDDQYKYQE
eukprot:403375343